MNTLKQLVREVREAKARGREFNEQTLQVELAIRRAMADQDGKRCSDWEAQVLRAWYGILPTELLAAVLGRTAHAVRKRAGREAVATGGGHGKQPSRRCACTGEMIAVGHPSAHTGEGAGKIILAERCAACGKSVLYQLSWTEV